MTSGLAHIDIPESLGPFKLFQKWSEDYKNRTKTNFLIFNLATSSNKGEVKNRNIALQELADDGFIFVTNLNSAKVKQMTENPKVAASFLFYYMGDDLRGITRQVRVEGQAERLPPEVRERIYNSQPLYAKIRSNLIIDQGVEVCWDDLKRRHDELLEKICKGELELKAPDHLVAYKIIPKQFDFYHSAGEEIADRILFKQCASGLWNHYHITA